MTENQQVLKERLQKLMSRKQSRKFYAKRLGITEDEVRNLIENIRRGQDALEEIPAILEYVTDLEDVIVNFSEDVKAGKGEVTAKVREEIKTLDELIVKCKIDTEKWNVERYVQNFWGNDKQPHWQVKAYLSKKTSEENFQKNFMAFLESYRPGPIKEIVGQEYDFKAKHACLIINKQDEHLNKFDINGSNSIHDRFSVVYQKVKTILDISKMSNYIDQIVYILGSDQFNSEWTGCTTRGTPQQNLVPYQEGFQVVCDYEVNMINLLRKTCPDIKVMYVPGNHDEHVGWHLIQWLRAYFKTCEGIKFDISSKYTKYMRYGKSAIMFNHGDAIKPAKLANIFPIQFKEEWSRAENFYIFTGDKHHEVSLDFNGIKFYQLPALSGSKSLWDEKNGYTCSKPELTAFLIEEEAGMTNIYKQPL